MSKKWVFLALFFLAIAGCGQREDPVKIVEIDGVRHVQNPAVPLKGTIDLKLEKVREVNPYDIDDVGMRYYGSARSDDGELLLFDLNSGESHRFGPEGKHLGRMITEGQGPGEFPRFSGLRLHFIGNEIWATSLVKIARFDREGRFIDETRNESNIHPQILVDGDRYLGEKSEWTEKTQKRKVVLVHFRDPAQKKDVEFFEAAREWMVRKGSSAFSDEWATPLIHFAYCPSSGKVYAALNLEYRIMVKDLAGNSLYVIERPYEPVKLSAKDKEIMADWALKQESMRWMLDAYPDTLAALYDLCALPRGYLAALRISGPKKIEVDVYDPDGRYVHILRLPEGMRLERHRFYSFGFSTQETRDEYPVYQEYRVKNLPAIFE
jgi:hypothetical protein